MAWFMLQTIGSLSAMSYLPSLDFLKPQSSSAGRGNSSDSAASSTSTSTIHDGYQSNSTRKVVRSIPTITSIAYLASVAYSIHKLSGVLARDHSYAGDLFSSRKQRLKDWKWEVNKLNGDYFLNNDGLLIFVRSWTRIPASPKACVILVHGLTEHSGLYDATARAMNEQNYVVLALDHQGHGRSEGDRFFVRRFKDVVEDVIALVHIAKDQFPGLDIFLLGHSMGGLVAILSAEKVQKDLKGLILSAPAMLTSNDSHDAYKSTIFKIYGTLGEFVPHLAITTLDLNECVKSAKMRSIMANDPLRQGLIPVRTGSEILDSIPSGLDAAKTLGLPLLVVHGSADKIVSITNSETYVKMYAHPEKTLIKIPGGLHDGLFEENGGETLPAILKWLDGRTSPSMAPWAHTVTNTVASVIKQGLTQLK